MAKKSIRLSDTKLVIGGDFASIVDDFILNMLSGKTDYGVRKQYLRDDVCQWLEQNNIKYKFNSRKARIKFYTDEDAALFIIAWM